jgi:acetyl esterase/lipase
MRTLALLVLLSSTAFADDPKPTQTLDLWPGQAPGEVKPLPPEAFQPSKAGQLEVKRLGNVSKPQIALYQPEKPNGTCIVVAPGGGYSILAIEHEGTDVAKWLNSLGVTAVVLKYRVPKREMSMPENLPMLQDAQRAIGLVRSKAAEWKIDPNRIGMLGFSAGGHLTACVCTNFEKRLYESVDDADQQSCRPDFAVLVYPGGVVKKGTTELQPQILITKKTPKMFFAHASDDVGSPPDNSIAIYRELRANQIPAEMHLFATGGHGFGMKTDKGPTSEWPKRCEEWMRAQAILK